jgi:hypothetical protein
MLKLEVLKQPNNGRISELDPTHLFQSLLECINKTICDFKSKKYKNTILF